MARRRCFTPTFPNPIRNLIALLKLPGPNVLWLGGDPADKFTWAPKGPGQTYGQVAESDVNEFAGFIKATGWTCLYAVNLAGASLP
jgi:hypothetical protein